MHDDFGARFKRYEVVSAGRLTPRSPIVIRVDGRAFHTLTKDMHRPFDHDFMQAMVAAAVGCAREMAGFRLGYVQSDEASFYLDDTETLTTQQWFGGEINKLVSISASLMTLIFVSGYRELTRDAYNLAATFDARAFTVPLDDLPNYFLWQHRDWNRNSLSMLAQAHFTAKQLHGKNKADMHEMLHRIGVNWADLTPAEKDGAYLVGKAAKRTYVADPSYERIKDMIETAKGETSG